MRLPSWIIVAAVGALIVLAAADALRPSAERTPQTRAGSTSTTTGGDLRGMLVVGSSCRSLRAIRLAGRVEVQAPRQTDCDGLVWSKDGTLYANCIGRSTYIGTAAGRRIAQLRGCAAAWREDGALGVIRDGALVVTRRRGRAIELVSRARLAEQLRDVVARPRSYHLVEIAWLGLNRFAAIVQGSRPREQAIVVLTTNGVLELALSQFGAAIQDLRASPFGNYLAFAQTRLGREFRMMPVEGLDVPLPRIGNALNVAWSPDESYVAISTRTATFIAETGSRRRTLQLPFGGRYLAWLP
jgi:hypothetical protein